MSRRTSRSKERRRRPPAGDDRERPTERASAGAIGLDEMHAQFGNSALATAEPEDEVGALGGEAAQQQVGNAAVVRASTAGSERGEAGRTAPGDVRDEMGGAFGEDLSSVAVQSGLPEGASQVGADAVAGEERVTVSSSAATATSGRQRALMGEEFAHVVQKRRGTVAPDEEDELLEGRDPVSARAESAVSRPREEAAQEKVAESDDRARDKEVAEATAGDQGTSPESEGTQGEQEESAEGEARKSAEAESAKTRTRGEADEGGAAESTAESAKAGAGADEKESLGEVVVAAEEQSPQLLESVSQTARTSEGRGRAAEGVVDREPGEGRGADTRGTNTEAASERATSRDEGSAVPRPDLRRRSELEGEARQAGSRAARGGRAEIRRGSRVPRHQFGVLGWLKKKAVGAGKALAGAASWVWRKANVVRRKIGNARNWVRDKIAGGWDVFTEKLGAAWKWAEGKFDGALDWLRENGSWPGRAVAWALDTYRDFLKGFWKGAYNAVAGILKLGYHLSQLVDPTEWIFNPENNLQRLDTLAGVVLALTTKEGWSQLWEGIKQPYVEAWSRGDYGEAIGMGVFEIVSLIFGAKGLGKAGKLGKAGRVAAVAGRAGRAGRYANLARIVGKISGSLSRLRRGLSRGFAGLRGAASALIKRFTGVARRFFTGLLGRVRSGIVRLVGRARQMISRVATRLRESFSRVVQRVGDAIKRLLRDNPIIRLARVAFDFLKRVPSLLRSLLNRVRNFIQRLIDRARRFVTDLVNRIVRRLQEAWRRLVARVQQVIAKLIERISKFVQRILDRILRTVRSWMARIFGAIQRIWQRITAALGRAWAAIRRKIEQVREWLRRKYDEMRGRGRPDEPDGLQRERQRLVELLHKRELGLDPQSGRFRPLEAEAGSRLEQRVGRLRRDPSGDADWIDRARRTYDAVGPVPPQHFDLGAFTRQIDRHLLKQGLDFVVVDRAGLSAARRAAVDAHINGLPAAQRARIIVQ